MSYKRNPNPYLQRGQTMSEAIEDIIKMVQNEGKKAAMTGKGKGKAAADAAEAEGPGKVDPHATITDILKKFNINTTTFSDILKEFAEAAGAEGPSKEDLHATITDILKKVDFNTTTFSDILKKLGAHYKMDMAGKEWTVKILIREELTKLAEEAEENEDEEEDEEPVKKAAPPKGKGPSTKGMAKPVLLENSKEEKREQKKEEKRDHKKESEKELESDLPKILANLPVPKKYAIFRLPESSLKNAGYFTPQVVSIGPCHFGKRHLGEMVHLKFEFFEDFLKRNPLKGLRFYWNKLEKLEPQLRKYYLSKLDIASNEFVAMMLLDGCFILEFLIKFYDHTLENFFEDASLLPYIKTDLLMFENQIPFMVLLKLYEPENAVSIYELLVNYLWDTSNGLPTLRSCGSHNLLHFYHLQFIPPYVDGAWRDTNSKEHCRAKFNEKHLSQIPSAQELERAGVIFRGKRTMNFLDITFHDRVLEIPSLFMNKPFHNFLVNLFTFEKQSVAHGNVMQTYCCFMKLLLSTPADVELVRKYGIIKSVWLSDWELCGLFGKFQDVDYENGERHYFANLFVDLWEFCQNVEKTAAFARRSSN